MTVKLDVTKREASAAKVRADGHVPGVVYGPKQESTPITVDGRTFEKMLHEAGEATIITLSGLGAPIEALIHDVSFNAARGGVEHVDFYAIEAGKEITVDVPLEFIGEAPAVKSGGTLTKVIHELEVTCRPSDLPSHIDVDVSVLVDEESVIKVRDVVLPAGVTLETDADMVVAMISGARTESEEPVAAVDMSAIEVEAKGKKEEDAE